MVAASAHGQVLHEKVRIRPLDCRDGICRSTGTGAGAARPLPEAILGPRGELVEAPEPKPVAAGEALWSPLDPAPGEGNPSPSESASAEGVPPAAAAKHRVGNYQIDRDTGPESGKHPYEEVFRPSVYPFKRSTALDRVVEGACSPARSGCVEPALAVRAPEATIARPLQRDHRVAGYDYFWGELAIELAADRPTPLPSPGPEAVLVAYEVVPAQSLDFAVDSAENWYVRGRRSGKARLVWLTGVPRRAFGGPIADSLKLRDLPAALQPAPSAAVRALAAPVIKRLGLEGTTGNELLPPVLEKLVGYFRSFETRPLVPGSGSTYVDLAFSRAGSCRHRSFAFVVTAQSLGIAARYIENELHVFVEVFIPRAGWRRIHLGGAGVESERLGDGGPNHQPPEDAWPKPPEFLAAERDLAEKEKQVAAKAAAQRAVGKSGGTTGGAGDRGSGASSGGSGDRVVAGGPSDGRSSAPVRNDPRAPKITPTLTAELSGGSTFRGETVEVRGRAQSGALGLPRLPVYVTLVGPSGKSRLGEGVTDERGEYRITVEIPKTLALGDYRVVVATDGDGERAAATAD